jgi:sugar phosphate isomerase/epimerase
MARITAISSLGWAHYTLYEALPRIAEFGFRRVEIASFFSYCFHFNFGSPTPVQLRKMLDSYGMVPICLNYCPAYYYAWKQEDVERFIHDMRRKIEQLGEVGIPMMTMPFGMRNDREDQDRQLEIAAKAFDTVAKIGEKYKVKMLIEVPHLYDIIYRPEAALKVFSMLESDNVGALVDSSHWGIINYDLDEFLSCLGSRLWHVHLRDSAGPDTGDMKQMLELTPGSGTVDFSKFGSALDHAGYMGDVSIEFEYRDMTFEAIEHEYRKGFAHLADCGWDFPEEVKSKKIF